MSEKTKAPTRAGRRGLGPKCGIHQLLVRAPVRLRNRLIELVEDPAVDPADAYHAVAAAFRYQASISPTMVEWHRYRGGQCPCGGPLPQTLPLGLSDDDWRPGEIRTMTAAVIANQPLRGGRQTR